MKQMLKIFTILCMAFIAPACAASDAFDFDNFAIVDSADADITMEDVDLFLLHQANARIIEAAAKRLHAVFSKAFSIAVDASSVLEGSAVGRVNPGPQQAVIGSATVQ